MEDATRILKGERPHQRPHQRAASGKGVRGDPLRKTLIIIDEAHNLYNTTDFKDEYDSRVLHRQGGIDVVEKM